MEKRQPTLRFPEFKGDWVKYNFKKLVKLQRGSSPRPIIKYTTTSSEGVNWIKISDIYENEAVIKNTKEKITKEGAKKSRFVKKGEIILSNSMSFGRPCILEIEGYIHDGWFVLREYERYFNKEYLCQLLGSEIVQKQYKKLAAGGVVSNISSELVNAVNVIIPSLPEQIKIANFLLAVDEKITLLKEKKDALETYKKGIMQKIFNQELRFKQDNGNEFPDWEEIILSDFAEVNKGNQLNKDDLNETDVFPCISGGIEPSGYTDKYNREENTIIISEGGNSCGYVNFIKTKFWCGGHCYSIEIFKDFNKLFIYQLLKFNQDEIMRLRVGSGLPNIQKKDLKNLNLFLPINPVEQTKIANFLSAIDEKINLLTTQIEDTQAYKKGLLQQIFC